MQPISNKNDSSALAFFDATIETMVIKETSDTILKISQRIEALGSGTMTDYRAKVEECLLATRERNYTPTIPRREWRLINLITNAVDERIEKFFPAEKKKLDQATENDFLNRLPFIYEIAFDIVQNLIQVLDAQNSRIVDILSERVESITLETKDKLTFTYN